MRQGASEQPFSLQRDLEVVHQLHSNEAAESVFHCRAVEVCCVPGPSDHTVCRQHTQIQLTRLPMLQRLLTVLVYQLNDDEAADDDNFGEEDHVSSFRQALFALPR